MGENAQAAADHDVFEQLCRPSPITPRSGLRMR
jgi:hypothetical protein